MLSKLLARTDLKGDWFLLPIPTRRTCSLWAGIPRCAARRVRLTTLQRISCVIAMQTCLPSNVSGTLLLPVDMLPEEVKEARRAPPLRLHTCWTRGAWFFRETEDPLFPVLFKLYVDRQNV